MREPNGLTLEKEKDEEKQRKEGGANEVQVGREGRLGEELR